MNRDEKWNEFLENLCTCACDHFAHARESAQSKCRLQEMDDTLAIHLTADQKQLVDEVLYEVESILLHERAHLYRQGYTDCIWLLKSLGVLA